MKNSEITLTELYAKYPYIVANSKIFGSNEYWTEAQLYEANHLNAPANTHRVSNGKYFTLDEIINKDYLWQLKELTSK